MKKQKSGKRIIAMLLALVMCVGMIPTAFAGQQNSYHDPAEHWMTANNRTNELDVNAVVTHETFNCCVCGKMTSFTSWRVPEYTKDGKSALTRNVMYSDGTLCSAARVKALFWMVRRVRMLIIPAITGQKQCATPAARPAAMAK